MVSFPDLGNINSQSKIVFLSGAGVSAESGISTFRDNGGLWEQYSIYEVATPEAWQA
ncbi:MAG: Sir2 family NAD-dependent protein deacetylase, partial [Owenweeksia sp.]